jgi:AcrR family transcriptional regulator
MTWAPDSGKNKDRGYHHGNLREALVRAAMELIEKNGPAGFTFADAARWAGVSSAAPYRHFRDRDALMADVARRGFEAFAQALVKAWNDGRPDPVAAFENVGKAYLHFAGTQPAYYAAMFESGLAADAYDDLREAADRAFQVLRHAAEAVSAVLPGERRPPAAMIAFHAWSLAHGIASLFGRGDATRRKLPMAPEDLLEAGMLVYLRGLGYGEKK